MLLTSGGRDGAVCVWDLQQHQCQLRLTGHKAPVSGCAFVQRSTLVSSSLDRTLRVYDLAAGGRCVRTLTEHDELVSAVVALPDGNTVASASSDCSVRVWDLRADQPCVATLFDHEAAVYGLVSLRNDADTLVSCSWDRTVKVWSLRMPPPEGRDLSAVGARGGRCIRTLRGHGDAVRAITQLDDDHVASAGWDCTIRLWDLKSEIQESEKQHDLPPAHTAAASSSSSVAAVSSNPSCIGVLRGHSGWVYCLSYLPSSQSLLSGAGDKTIRVTDLHTGETGKVVQGHENTIWSVAAIPNVTTEGRTTESESPALPSSASSSTYSFASCGGDAQLRLWDLEHERCTRISGGHAPVQGIASSIHALDTWPPARYDKDASKPIKFKLQQQEQEQEQEETMFTTRAPLASSAIAPSSSAASSSFSSSSASSSASAESFFCESLESRPAALRSSPKGPVSLSSDVSHASHSLGASSGPLANSLLGSGNLSKIPCSFDPAPAHFLKAVDYDAIVAKAAQAAVQAQAQAAAAATAGKGAAKEASPKSSAAASSAASSSSSSAVSAGASSSGASASSSTTSAAVSFLSSLRSLREEVLSAFSAKDHALAESKLLHMIELVEAEQERPSSASSSTNATATAAASVAAAGLSASSLSSLLCSLLHDSSVCAFSQGAYGAALRYGTRALAAFEGDAGGPHDHDEDTDDDDDDNSDHESDRKSSSATMAKKTPRSKSRRALLRERERHLLLGVRREPMDDLADMIPQSLSIAATDEYGDDTAEAETFWKQMENGIDAAPATVSIRPSTSLLYLSLQLRRFSALLLSAPMSPSSSDSGNSNNGSPIDAALSAHVSLSLSVGQILLARISPTDQSRETILDEIESALRRPSVRGFPPTHPVVQQTIPLHSTYAHLIWVYHTQVLVAFLYERMQFINTAIKEKANTLFAQGVKEKTPSCFTQAILLYNSGITECQEIEDLLADPKEQCPSWHMTELAAAQIAVPNQTKAKADAGNSEYQPAGSMLLPSVQSIPPFSLHALHFLRASLHSNLSMAALKLSDDEWNKEEVQAKLHKATTGGSQFSALPHPGSNQKGFARGRRRGTLQQRAAARAAHGGAPASAIPPSPSSFEVLDPTSTGTDCLRLLCAQRSCEAGIELMEDLGRLLPPIRSLVNAANKAPAPYKGKPSSSSTQAQQYQGTDGHDDNDEDRNIYVENLSLGAALPSISSCNALSSKLYFRHGCACLDRGLDSVADLSFRLAVQMQPEEKTRQEIKDRKLRREKEIERKERKETEERKRQREQQQKQQSQSPASATASAAPAEQSEPVAAAAAPVLTSSSQPD